MPRIVRCGLIQASCEWSPEKHSLDEIKKRMIAKHERLIEAAGKRKVQVLGLQELFYGPLCLRQSSKPAQYRLDLQSLCGPPSSTLQKLAKKNQMVMIIPVYEIQMAGDLLLYRRQWSMPMAATSAQISKTPHSALPSRILGRSFHFTQWKAAAITSSKPIWPINMPICYDRHFPNSRILGMNGATLCSTLGNSGRAFRITTSVGAAAPRSPKAVYFVAPNIRVRNRKATQASGVPTAGAISAIRVAKSSGRGGETKMSSL